MSNNTIHRTAHNTTYNVPHYTTKVKQIIPQTTQHTIVYNAIHDTPYKKVQQTIQPTTIQKE